MKSFKVLAIILIGLVFLLVGCHSKSVNLKDTPNFLSKVDLTPGEANKEVSVFLYLYSKDVEYNITSKGQENIFLALTLKNTLKAEEINKIDLSGVDHLIESARAVQIVDQHNEEDPLSTRITFKLIDEETEIIPIIQEEPVKNIASYKSAMNMAEASSSGFNKQIHNTEHPIFVLCSVAFWILLIVGIVIIGTISKKKKANKPKEEHLKEKE